MKLLVECIFVMLEFEKENLVKNNMLICSPLFEIISHLEIVNSDHYVLFINRGCFSYKKIFRRGPRVQEFESLKGRYTHQSYYSALDFFLDFITFITLHKDLRICTQSRPNCTRTGNDEIM